MSAETAQAYILRGKIISARKRERLIRRDLIAQQHRAVALTGGGRRECHRRIYQMTPKHLRGAVA